MSRKRSTYRPKGIRIPVTPGLIAVFESEMRTLEIGLLMGPSTKTVDGWLRMLNSVAMAAEAKALDPAAVVRIRSAALHLKSMAERGRVTGRLAPTPLEAEQAGAAVADARALLPRLDVGSLLAAYRHVVAVMDAQQAPRP